MCLEQTLGFQPPLGTGDFWKVPAGLMLRDALALLHHSHQRRLSPQAGWPRGWPWVVRRCSEAPQTRFGVAPQWVWSLPGPCPAQAPCDGPGGQERGWCQRQRCSPQPCPPVPAPRSSTRGGKKESRHLTTDSNQHVPSSRRHLQKQFWPSQLLFPRIEHTALNRTQLHKPPGTYFFQPSSSTWLFPGGGTDHKHEPANLR